MTGVGTLALLPSCSISPISPNWPSTSFMHSNDGPWSVKIIIIIIIIVISLYITIIHSNDRPFHTDQLVLRIWFLISDQRSSLAKPRPTLKNIETDEFSLLHYFLYFLKNVCFAKVYSKFSYLEVSVKRIPLIWGIKHTQQSSAGISIWNLILKYCFRGDWIQKYLLNSWGDPSKEVLSP